VQSGKSNARQNGLDFTHYKANKEFHKVFAISGLNLFILGNE